MDTTLLSYNLRFIRTVFLTVPLIVLPILGSYNLYALQSVDVGETESLIIKYTNDYRHKNGLNPLKPDIRLMELARDHSRDMVKRGFFSHINPDKQSAADRAHLAGITDKKLSDGTFVVGVAENIGKITYGKIIDLDREVPHTPEGIASIQMRLWINSFYHRRNILFPDFEYIGVGVIFDGERYYLTTQVFR